MLYTPCSVLGQALFHEPAVQEGGENIVIVRDISFASTSDSTLLPFHGRCHIGYVPSRGVVLGLSKLARLTKLFAKRLQSQESLGMDIAAQLYRHLACHGVVVVIEAKHLVMARAAPPPTQTTVATCGLFAQEGSSQLQVRKCTLQLCFCCGRPMPSQLQRALAYACVCGRPIHADGRLHSVAVISLPSGVHVQTT